ncbi:hypothetical protein SXCC_04781 [Gluconacetobacter sp. SXCC-1]|nr:hypothetical protein SXCC_04781 [Gluconacetobacter sp. SXCC-1]
MKIYNGISESVSDSNETKLCRVMLNVTASIYVIWRSR